MRVFRNVSTRRLLGTAICGSLVFALAGTAPQAAEGTSKFKAPPNDKPTLYTITKGKPFIDVDEWRDMPRRHRYVHGGFENSHLLFSAYFPPKELYKERFLLELEGGVGGQDKMITQPNYNWAFNLAFDELGAYLLETNEGHYPDEGIGSDNAHDLWQASGYATSYIRNIAKEMYGQAPKRGYTNGCSGGGLRSSYHLEMMPDLIDASVPQSFSETGRLIWGPYALAGTLVGPKVADVIDALEVGGSGDPYKGLDKRQSDALRDVLALGFPRDGISQFKDGGFAAQTVRIINISDQDPIYYKDFWEKPGYVGHDNPKQVEDMILDTTVTVDKVLTSAEVMQMTGSMGGMSPNPNVATYPTERGNVEDRKKAAVIKYDGPLGKLRQATVTILSGADQGKTMIINDVREGNVILPFLPRAPFGFDNVKPGDKLKISNRDFIAYMHYARYGGETMTRQSALQTPEHRQLYPQFKIYMDEKGQSKHVQRPTPIYEEQPAIFKGKMILVTGTGDEPVWPTAQFQYEQRLRKNLGANFDNQFRFRWVEHHLHCGGSLDGPRSTGYVPPTGVVSQAIRDAVKWAEEGIAPPPSTVFRFADDNALVLPATAKERKGVQPVVTLAANGGARTDVKVGTPVKFTATAEVPPGTGTLVKAQFDFDGEGKWPEAVAGVDGSSATLNAAATHTFFKPGTYFVAFRVASHLGGAKGKGEPIYNLARARVVVK